MKTEKIIELVVDVAVCIVFVWLLLSFYLLTL